MKTAILGAGASHSYAGSKTGIEPPLANSIFETFKKLDISSDPQVLISFILTYVRETRGIHPVNFGNWNEDIEIFLSEIHESLHKALVAAKTDKNGENLANLASINNTYNQCIFLFASIINEIQNGILCENYKIYSRNFLYEDAFIVFNWDCLLDRVLSESQKWSPNNGYGINFLGFFDDGWTSSVPSLNGPLLIKLHGSTNWLMPYWTSNFLTCDFSFVNNQVPWENWKPYCFIQASKCFETYHGRSKSGYEPFSYYYYPPNLPIPHSIPQEGYVNFAYTCNPSMPEHGKPVPHSDQAAYPMIIPPVKRKEYDLFPSMKPLWDKAWNHLVETDLLEIIGYSFPPTDTQPWYMLVSAVKARKSRLNITLVDPFPEKIASRLEDSLGDKIYLTVHKKTFTEYVSSTFI